MRKLSIKNKFLHFLVSYFLVLLPVLAVYSFMILDMFLLFVQDY